MRIRVLVADDAPFIREVVRHLLIKSGMDVIGEASDGEQAVELARATEPDVILMDMVMPNKNGVEATKEILKARPQTRILACSTLDQQSLVLQALDAGCCEFVVKPFEIETLVQAIQHSIQPTHQQGGR